MKQNFIELQLPDGEEQLIIDNTKFNPTRKNGRIKKQKERTRLYLCI